LTAKVSLWSAAFGPAAPVITASEYEHKYNQNWVDSLFVKMQNVSLESGLTGLLLTTMITHLEVVGKFQGIVFNARLEQPWAIYAVPDMIEDYVNVPIETGYKKDQLYANSGGLALYNALQDVTNSSCEFCG